MTAQAPTPYSQEASREEKARILREQDRAINTLAAHQAMLDPSLGGRFAKTVAADFTVGRDPTVEYPRLPSGSPWSQTQPPPEEPFNVDIQYVEPCGTPAEIERSAAILSAATDNLQGGSCAEAGYSSPATTASLSSTAGPAEGPSPVPETTSPVGSDDSATDPTPRGSAGQSSSDSSDQPTGHPSAPAGSSCEGETKTGNELGPKGGAFPRPSFRRLG